MSFYQRFELLEPLPSQDVKMFKGREIATGQPIVAHLMVAGRTPENEALLAQVAKLAPPFASHVRDVGEHEGTPYVVTDVLPGGIGLREYVRTAVAATPRVPAPAPPPPQATRPDPAPFTRVGMWRVPARPGEQKPAPEAPKPAADDFDRMFEQPPAQVPRALERRDPLVERVRVEGVQLGELERDARIRPIAGRHRQAVARSASELSREPGVCVVWNQKPR